MQQNLLNWHDRHRRDLPWRDRPCGERDPYLVWLSEVMLQQTTVASVKSYFATFRRRWPNVATLAAAETDDVMAAWAGLGYYTRARNLVACARLIASELNGQFPHKPDELRKLPGIGPYTSNAIASIAFNEPVLPIDGNVERVFARFHALETPLPALKKEVAMRARDVVPADRAGDFAEALMDLGATICMPRKANCDLCPLSNGCLARDNGLTTELPRRPAKKKRPTRIGTAFVVERDDGSVLLRRRPDQGLLGGMLEVPSTVWCERGVTGSNYIEHTFTHFHLKLGVEQTKTIDRAEQRDPLSEIWVPRAKLVDCGLPTVMKKVLAAVFGPGVFKR